MKEKAPEKSERMTPSELETPAMQKNGILPTCGKSPEKLSVEQIDKRFMPAARKTAPGSVGF